MALYFHLWVCSIDFIRESESESESDAHTLRVQFVIADYYGDAMSPRYKICSHVLLASCWQQMAWKWREDGVLMKEAIR